MGFRKRLCAGLIGGIVSCLSLTAMAQTAPNDIRVEKDITDKTPPKSPDFVPAVGASELNCNVTEDAIRQRIARGESDPNAFLISRINFTDSEGGELPAGKFDRVKRAANAYAGQRTNLEGLRAIAVRAQCELRSKGNVLSAVRVPPQSFDRTGADIDLKIILGRVVEVNYVYNGQRLGSDVAAASGLNGAERRALLAVQKHFTALKDSDYEADKDLERAVLLATRVPGVSLRPSLRKAEGYGEGAVTLTVDIVEFDAFRGDLTIFNYSPEALGRWGPLLQLTANSQILNGDTLNVSAYTSTNFETQRVFRGTYDAPIARNWNMSLYGSYGEANPRGVLTDIELATESIVLGAELSRKFIVRTGLQLDAYLGGEYIKQDLEVIGTPISNDKINVISGGVRGLVAKGPFLSQFDLEVRQGVDILGASDQGSVTISRIGANPEATVFRANINNTLRLGNRLEFRAALEGQYSKDPLLAYEEYSVGNFTTGRGYEPGQLSGDSAAAGAFEIGLGPYSLSDNRSVIANISASPYIFYDAVQVYNEDLFSEDRFVDSYGAGISFNLWERFSADLAYAYARKSVFSFTEDEPGGTVLVRFGVNF